MIFFYKTYQDVQQSERRLQQKPQPVKEKNKTWAKFSVTKDGSRRDQFGPTKVF